MSQASRRFALVLEEGGELRGLMEKMLAKLDLSKMQMEL